MVGVHIAVLALGSVAAALVGCAPKPEQLPSAYIDPRCPPLPGAARVFRSDLIHDRRGAEKIAEAVLEGVYSREQLKEFAGFELTDQGRWWAVGQRLPKETFGTSVSFRINKCTGTVENFTYWPE